MLPWANYALIQAQSAYKHMFRAPGRNKRPSTAYLSFFVPSTDCPMSKFSTGRSSFRIPPSSPPPRRQSIPLVVHGFVISTDAAERGRQATNSRAERDGGVFLSYCGARMSKGLTDVDEAPRSRQTINMSAHAHALGHKPAGIPVANLTSTSRILQSIITLVQFRNRFRVLEIVSFLTPKNRPPIDHKFCKTFLRRSHKHQRCEA